MFSKPAFLSSSCINWLIITASSLINLICAYNQAFFDRNYGVRPQRHLLSDTVITFVNRISSRKNRAMGLQRAKQIKTIAQWHSFSQSKRTEADSGGTRVKIKGGLPGFLHLKSPSHNSLTKSEHRLKKTVPVWRGYFIQLSGGCRGGGKGEDPPK